MFFRSEVNRLLLVGGITAFEFLMMFIIIMMIVMMMVIMMKMMITRIITVYINPMYCCVLKLIIMHLETYVLHRIMK